MFQVLKNYMGYFILTYFKFKHKRNIKKPVQRIVEQYLAVIEDAIPLHQYMSMEIVVYLVYIISPLLCGLVIATLVYVLLEFRLTEAWFIKLHW